MTEIGEPKRKIRVVPERQHQPARPSPVPMPAPIPRPKKREEPAKT